MQIKVQEALIQSRVGKLFLYKGVVREKDTEEKRYEDGNTRESNSIASMGTWT